MVNALPAGVEGSTRDRLLAAAIELFAERGFRATTVGDIEAVAGLQPRRGALYYYFETKEAVLDAAVELLLARIDLGLAQMDELPGVDVRTEALLMGRWFLAELDAERYLVRILEQDGDRIPEIRERVRDRAIDEGHRRVEQLLRRRLPERAGLDTASLAALVIGPLAHHRRVAWTYGAPPLGIDDDRLLETWANTQVALMSALGGNEEAPRRRRAARH